MVVIASGSCLAAVRRNTCFCEPPLNTVQIHSWSKGPRRQATAAVQSDDMRAIVLSMRGCHLAYLGCYGNTWVSTPALDRLAAAGVVFDQHLADVPETVAARCAWRDGRHHLPDPATLGTLPPTFDLLSTLRAQGVRTVLVADG